MTPCPCDSGKPYHLCCEIYHLGTPAPTAEALMRSRYSAYALASSKPDLKDYLLRTWHSNSRPQDLNLEGQEAIKWLGLQVKQYQNIDADNATVEFVARYKYANNLGGKAEKLQETSRFKRVDHCWFYLDGDYQ
ncbi:hypothetical protein C3Y98_01505 [Methylotenera oryzisoli]|uniref:YchJ-like middle NTF2-like domain-containing protein n=1 Tax=Methylotenera oryzisoli TaxID=2080758 RepID=A0A4Y9VVF9_9PROT|nr:YchJ family metal-binding protein [Methylotenera oryzisoli]TFW73059.1 hypothetical protein C3Y98_01505 [Methylotenera oryzisoli]